MRLPNLRVPKRMIWGIVAKQDLLLRGLRPKQKQAMQKQKARKTRMPVWRKPMQRWA